MVIANFSHTAVMCSKSSWTITIILDSEIESVSVTINQGCLVNIFSPLLQRGKDNKMNIILLLVQLLRYIPDFT